MLYICPSCVTNKMFIDKVNLSKFMASVRTMSENNMTVDDIMYQVFGHYDCRDVSDISTQDEIDIMNSS